MVSTAKKTKPPRDAARKLACAPLPVVEIPVTKIDPSPLNRDATADISQLAQSIKDVGQQEAIKVRPKGDRFEIVYGERRWRAVKHLGLTTIHATVEDVDDNTAIVLRAVENLQRKDPHPLEEAEQYERLLSLKDSNGKPLHTPESIAEVVAGRSPAYVYQRLKLTALAPELRKAVYEKKLSLGGAFLVARSIPTKLQPEAWTKLRQFEEEGACPEDLDDEGLLNRRAIAMIIEHDYTTRLAFAPFSLKEAKLLPAAGSCDACTKRSGTQKFLFDADDPKDTCTDLRCFRAKVTAFVEREKARVMAQGGRVLSDEESRRIFQGGTTLPFRSKWLDLNAAKPGDPENRSYRKLLGDLCPPPVLAFTSQNKPVLLADQEVLASILRDNGLDPQTFRKLTPANKKSAQAPETTASAASQATAAGAGAAQPPHPDDPDTDEDLGDDPDEGRSGSPDPRQEVPADPQVARKCRQRILATIVAAAESVGADDNRFVQVVYETMLHGGFSNAIADTVRRRVSNRPKGEHPSSTLGTHAQGLSPQQVRGLVLELALSRSGYFVGGSTKYPQDLKRAMDLYQVDPDTIEKAAAEELSIKRAARPDRSKAAGA